jgi:hypothetical protein
LDDLQTAIDDAPGEILSLDFCRGQQTQMRKVAVTLTSEPVRSAA